MKNVYGPLKCERISTYFWEVFPYYGVYVLDHFIYKICIGEVKKGFQSQVL